MHILLTNDDGITAPGLAALEAAVASWATVTVVAPHQQYSGCGHRVTNHESLRVEQLGDRRYKVYGTPADCTRLGLAELAVDARWVVSGINDGGNLGVDVVMSGTVAAVREAVWMGKPGIAISQYARRDRPRNWSRSQQMAERVLQHLWERSLGQREFWNVNLPDGDDDVEKLELRDTFLEPQHLPIRYQRDPTGEYRYRGDYRPTSAHEGK